MRERGSTTLQAVIIFMIIALIMALIAQTVQFVRVRTVVQNASEEAARVYASNYDSLNKEAIAKDAALKLLAANLPLGRVTGTYTSNNVPPGWIQGVLGKTQDGKYTISGMPYEAATEGLKAKLDSLIGKNVAVRVEGVEDDSAKYRIVDAVSFDLTSTDKLGVDLIQGQLEFSWYSPVSSSATVPIS